MATPIVEERAPVRPSDIPSTADTTEPTHTPDPQLDAAVAEAGEHPERAAALARDLGLSRRRGLPHVNPNYDPEVDGPLTPTLHAVLGTFVESFVQRGRALPDVPTGALDAGLARVMAEESEGDHSIKARLMVEADASVMLARLLSGVIEEWHYEATDNNTRSASSRKFAARLFRAGFLMGDEAAAMRTMDACVQAVQRFPTGRAALGYVVRYGGPSALPECPKGSVDELVTVWRLLEGTDKVNVSVSTCWWSADQIEQARSLVHAETRRWPVILKTTAPTLLRADLPADDPRRMPFVIDDPAQPEDDQRNFWCPQEAFPEYAPQEQGTLCAAAFLAYIGQVGSAFGPLNSIVRAMPAEHTICETYFFRFIELCIHAATASRPTNYAAFAQQMIDGERQVKEIYEPDDDDHASFDDVQRLATALGCTVRDLIAGPEAYTGGGQ